MQTEMLPVAGTLEKAQRPRRIARVVVYLLAELGRNSLWLAGTTLHQASAAPEAAWHRPMPAEPGANRLDVALHDEAVRHAWRQRAEQR